MVDLKPKVVLGAKGETVNLPEIKQLVAAMSWKSSVDLDLIALYERKDGGDANGVSFKNLGDLNVTPFIKLSGDAGVGGAVADGGNLEELKIVDLKDISKLHLIALNYTEAQKTQTDSAAKFTDYDGHIVLTDDLGNNFDVPLTNPGVGTVAHIATIDNTGPINATLEMKDEVMQFNQFLEVIPGAMKVFG